jgi:hypothetical protein
MVEDQVSDLYELDTDTWLATSLVQGSGMEPTLNSHSPSGSRTHKEPPSYVKSR